LYLPFASAQLCASSPSYCLSGLSLFDNYDSICTQYKWAGSLNGCAYFESIHGGVYLWWYVPPTGSSSPARWTVSPELNSDVFIAYCTEPSLDDCTSSKWYHYDGSQTYLNQNMRIEACEYDNAQCLASYTSNHSFCLSDTKHREFNKDLAGSYLFSGCLMNQPYFVRKVTSTASNVSYNIIVQWDDVLAVWHISTTFGSAGGAISAYCLESNLSDCSQNWYIHDGDGVTLTLDQKVMSGFCNKCVVEKTSTYDEICVVGGVPQNNLIGRYLYADCERLYPMYRSVLHEDYTIEFMPNYEEYFILQDSKFIKARCTGSDLSVCVEHDEQWAFNNATSGEYEIRSTFQISGDCASLKPQCNNASVDAYCLVVYDEIANDVDADYGGRYEFDHCDANEYPVFYQVEDSNGSAANYSVISFDALNTLYSIAERDGSFVYASCNAMSLDVCDAFWAPQSRHFSLSKCIADIDHEVDIFVDVDLVDTAVKLDVVAAYWYVFYVVLPMLAVLLLAVCVGCMVYRYRQRQIQTRSRYGHCATISDGNGINMVVPRIM
jgi:hypothetical protein